MQIDQSNKETELYIRETEVFKGTAKLLSLPFKIEILIRLNDAIVLLVSNDPSLEDQNIFCYSLTGDLKWQIPRPVKIHDRNYYSSVYLIDSELYAYSVSGVEYLLDEKTGQILKSQLIK